MPEGKEHDDEGTSAPESLAGLQSEGAEQEAVERILALYRQRRFTLPLPYSVKAEIEHPNTPAHVKARARELIFTTPVELTPPELELVARSRDLMRGNAASGKHDADAFHVVEAAKYGGRHFITNDTRILSKKAQISELTGIDVVTPTEFLARYDFLRPRATRR
jgi:predicted nucleic acid-binding protein